MMIELMIILIYYKIMLVKRWRRRKVHKNKDNMNAQNIGNKTACNAALIHWQKMMHRKWMQQIVSMVIMIWLKEKI